MHAKKIEKYNYEMPCLVDVIREEIGKQKKESR
jgi:hypothetical protein